MSERVCLECSNYHVVVPAEKEGELPQLGECRAKPPAVFMLAHQAQRLDGKAGVEVRFPAAWPQLQPMSWCAEFARKNPLRVH